MNIVRNIYSEGGNGWMPVAPPENVPKGDFLYYLNTRQLPVLAEGVISLQPGVRNEKAQKLVSGKFNEVEKRMMDASHLIAREFGGSGEFYNLIPLPREFNQKQIRAFERNLKDHLASGDLYLQVFASYQGAQEVADHVLYRAYETSAGRPTNLLRENSFLVLH